MLQETLPLGKQLTRHESSVAVTFRMHLGDENEDVDDERSDARAYRVRSGRGNSSRHQIHYG